jgi:HAE1 family hydrophobic/amphiphilic exporter-1
VDNSIVVLENIDRHVQMGKSKRQAAFDGAQEVATPVLTSTLVIMVVFFPVMFLTGMAKFLFSPLAITVAGAMIGSYIFSLTLVPLAARIC